MRFRSLFFFLLFFLPFFSFANDEEFWIADVRVASPDLNSFKPGAIKIHHGKIEAIASQAPVQSRVRFFPGMFAVPGLINAHVHILGTAACEPGYGFSPVTILENLRGWARSGFTTVADMGGWPGLVSKIRKWAEADSALGPRVLMAGPIVTAEGGYPDYWMPVSARAVGALRFLDAAAGRDVIRDLARSKADYAKVALQEMTYGGKPLPMISGRVLKEFVGLAHQHGLKVMAHALTTVGYKAGLEAGVDAFIHGPQDPLPEDMIGLFARRQIPIVPTIWIWKSPWSVPEEGFDSARFAGGVSGQIRKSWDKYLKDYSSGNSFPDTLVHEANISKSRAKERIRDLLANLDRLRKKGAFFVFGTDAPYCFNTAGSSYREMAELKKAGFANREILQMATVNAALFLGREGEIGRLEAGKKADIVLLRKNPLEDLQTLEEPVHVFRDGLEIGIDKGIPLEDKIKVGFLFAAALVEVGMEKIFKAFENEKKH
ncbi:MAG: amidohydrolase family protein [Elusimicrobia bacterium]|nr:amidohydrolase family protein [Elusimicrobiota bacterium]